MKRKFPNSRLRRLRLNSSIIDLVSENTLNSADLIQPVFVKENLNGSEPIESMPNVNRYGIDSILICPNTPKGELFYIIQKFLLFIIK